MIKSLWERSFPNGTTHAFLTIIDLVSKEQAFRNAEIARNAGADGIFFRSNCRIPLLLLETYVYVLERLPGFFIGINCTGMLPTEMLKIIPRDLAGFLVDNAGIDASTHEPTDQARKFKGERDKKQGLFGWAGLYFGGVACTDYPGTSDLEGLAKAASYHADVIVTTVSTKGSLAEGAAKLAFMKKGVGQQPFVLKMTDGPENVRAYMLDVDGFLFDEWIRESPTELNWGRIREVAKVLARYKGEKCR